MTTLKKPRKRRPQSVTVEGKLWWSKGNTETFAFLETEGEADKAMARLHGGKEGFGREVPVTITVRRAKP